jgi:photoactive yellow protein
MNNQLDEPFAPLSALFDALPVGVVVLDRLGRVIFYNRAEERMAGRARESVIGRRFFSEVAPCLELSEIAVEFQEGVEGREMSRSLECCFPYPLQETPRDVILHLQSLEIKGEPCAVLIIEDISERRGLERARRTLADLLVHDMKNPLTAILSNADFIEGISVLSGEALEALEDIRSSAEQLRQMSVQLLDVSRLEDGDMPMNRALTSVSGLLRQCVRRAELRCRARDVSLSLSLDSAPAEAVMDPALVRRAVDNLLENALRYSRGGEQIELSARILGDGLRIEVADRGPGVPLELRELVFEKYARVEGRGRFNRGLGLTFVRLAAQAHGGLAGVGDRPGGGACFYIELPTAGEGTSYDSGLQTLAAGEREG